MSDSTTTEGRRRRRWPWIVGGVVVVLLAVGAWLGLGLRAAAGSVQGHATAAEAALTDARTALTSGDYAGAKKAADLASGEVEAARVAADVPAVRVVGKVPVANQAVDDLDRLISAAGLVASATSSVVDVYGGVTGKLPDVKPLLRAGVVNLASLGAVGKAVDSASGQLAEATDLLHGVQATLPGTARFAVARDSALAGIESVSGTMRTVQQVLPQLPAALGAKKPQRYLIAILNQSEMRAGGGAPLSVAVVTFDKGRFSVGERGSVAQLTWPGDGVLTWVGAKGSPWNDAKGLRTSRFASANFHPDFRSAGYDIGAAWRAGDRGTVAGVIGIDLTAIAGVLRATGPIPDTPFGTLTGDNLGKVLLVDAYRDFSSDQQARQRATETLVDVMLQRMLSGTSLVPTVKALGAAAPARHFQVQAADPKLAATLDGLGLAGTIQAPKGSDVVAFSSQNLNASKVDVFAQRHIEVNVEVAADGSATVDQTAHLTNAIPSDIQVSSAKEGYTTAWSQAEYFFYRPSTSLDPEVVLPDDFHLHPWTGAQDWVDDGHGHQLTRLWGWLPPRGTADVSLHYRLPAGTFRTADGALAYRITATPQPTWNPASLTLTVRGPDGQDHAIAETLDHVVDVVVPVR